MATITIGNHSKIVARPAEQDCAALRNEIIAFGVHRIEMPGADHLYFHAPGGQVFRVVAEGDDLGRFEG